MTPNLKWALERFWALEHREQQARVIREGLEKALLRLTDEEFQEYVSLTTGEGS